MKMEESLKSSVDQMKVIFDLCDHDKDGLIFAKDFKEIGRQYFEKPDKVNTLLGVIDPHNTGKISFVMFCRGIETFLQENQQTSNSTDSSFTSLTSEMGGGSSTEFKDYEEVYPISHPSATSLSNGYVTGSSTGGGVELVIDPCVEDDSPNSSRHYRSSTPGSSSPGVTGSRGSPTMAARLRRHQLTLPDGSSQGSTPAEEEVVVGRLNDQLLELSSRLEELEEDQKDSEGHRMKLKKENMLLKARLEEYEENLRATEYATEKALSDSQDRLKTAVNKVRRESETRVLDLKSQLELAKDRISQMEKAEIGLKAQLFLTEEEKIIFEKEALEQEEQKNTLQDALQKTREQLRMETEKWKLEKVAYIQGMQDRDLLVQQMKKECEELQEEQKRLSVTATDMEIHTLKKKLEQSEHRNEELQSRFFQEGKELLAAASASPPSLAVEIDSASKADIAEALKKSEDVNSRLNHYIEGLLATIMEKHPELLEKA